MFILGSPEVLSPMLVVISKVMDIEGDIVGGNVGLSGVLRPSP